MVSNGHGLGFEQKLWSAADKLRNNMDAAEYKHVVLGLIFLKYISDSFEGLYTKLKNDPEGLSDPEDIDETHPTLEGTLTPLHASKAAGDMYCKVYADTYGLDVASFRLTGIYGTRQFGGEDHGWVANFAIRSVLGWPVTIFGRIFIISVNSVCIIL